VQAILDQAPADPVWLDYDVLSALQTQYSSPPDYGYDPASLKRRGDERAALLLKKFPNAKAFLEVGCYDGMVSCALAVEGKGATGIDARSSGFDSRARGGRATGRDECGGFGLRAF